MRSGKTTRPPAAVFDLPQPLKDFLRGKAQWDPVAAEAFLDDEKATIAKIRAIGLMPERSSHGIDVGRYVFTSARLAKNFAEALMLDARLAADRGDAATALESIRAAKGLGDHLHLIETPTLLAATIQIIVQTSLEEFVLTEIIPALSGGKVDPGAWENVLRPGASPPAEFARLMKGEWSVTVRYFLIPHLLNGEIALDPEASGDFLDAHAATFAEIVRSHEYAELSDLPKLDMPPEPDLTHLPDIAQELLEIFQIGIGAWRKGWDRAQSASARTQAAFAILKGLPVPKDRIYSLDYRWDPATRELAMPAGAQFDEMGIEPIIVPIP